MGFYSAINKDGIENFKENLNLASKFKIINLANCFWLLKSGQVLLDRILNPKYLYNLQPNLQIQMFQELCHSICEQEKLEKVSGEFNHIHIIELRSDKTCDGAKKAEKINISLPSKAGPEVKDRVLALAKELKQKHKSQVNLGISQKKSAGEAFEDYGEIKKIFEEGTSKLAAKEGQVLLVDVWATWCGPCQKPMAHNQEMLTKNDWGDRVRIVGVSVDDSFDDVKERVESRGWKSIEHLGLGKWDSDHGLIKDFQIQGIPFVCLVDTKGIINYIGHPMSINLQERINQLLKANEQSGKEQKNEESVKQQVLGEIINTFSNQEWFQKNFGEAQFLSMKLVAKSLFQQKSFKNNIEISVYATSRDEGVLAQFEKMVPPGVKLTKKVIEEEQIPAASNTCKQCNSQLKYPLYWCRWNDNQFRCRECIQKTKSAEQNYYQFNNNSILLMTETKSLPKANFGKNIQPTNIKQEVQDPNQFGCNGCSSCPDEIGIARYVCLQCRSEPNYNGDYVDVCQSCINKYITGDEQVCQNLNVEGHTKDHAFVRVLFNVRGYYEY